VSVTTALRAGCALSLAAAIAFWLPHAQPRGDEVLLLAALVVLEELVFRAWLLRAALRRMRLPFAVLAASAAFASVHAPSAWPMTFAMGLLLAMVYLRGGTLLAPIALHAAHNLVTATVRAPSWSPGLLTANEVLGLLALAEFALLVLLVLSGARSLESAGCSCGKQSTGQP
jgi:membrane protease YdiL (CAAX protease family)